MALPIPLDAPVTTATGASCCAQPSMLTPVIALIWPSLLATVGYFYPSETPPSKKASDRWSNTRGGLIDCLMKRDCPADDAAGICSFGVVVLVPETRGRLSMARWTPWKRCWLAPPQLAADHVEMVSSIFYTTLFCAYSGNGKRAGSMLKWRFSLHDR
jgi:hypothetical protein